MKKSLAVILLATASLLSATTKNLVNNPGFETGDFTGWTIGGPELALNGGPLPDPGTTIPADGNQFIGVQGELAPGLYPPNSGTYASYYTGGAFNTSGTSMTLFYTLSQDIATTPGQLYTVSLYVANDTDADPTHGYYNGITGTFGTGTALSLLNLPGSAGAFAYLQYTFYGLATSTTTTLSLNIDNSAGYFDIDDISVTAGTPEPSPFTLIAPSLAGLLYLACRSRRA